MLSIQVLTHGLIYSGGFALIILISVLINPRIWMQDFPVSLQSHIPQKNKKEVHQTFVTGLFFALFILGFPLFSLISLFRGSEEFFSFSSLFIHSVSVMMICNILYWLFMDILIFNLVVSRIRTVPGLKRKFKFLGWKRQVFGMVVGSLSCGLISLIVVFIALFFQN